jgi:hypothetical protein
MFQMQTIHETRRQRLAMLKREFGKWSKLNKELGWEVTSARLSQILSGTIRSDRGTPYVMGDETAREIEQKLGKPSGWMDTPPTYAELHGESSPRDQLLAVMEQLPPDQYATATRLLTALTEHDEAKNGTQH